MFRHSLTLCCLGTLATIVAQTDTPEIEPCPGDYSLVQNEYCYFISTIQGSWDEAYAACEERNGWLVVVKSASQNYGLREWLEDSGMSFQSFYSGPYIGIRRFNTSTTDFTWSHEPDQDSSYTNWKTDIPYITSGLDNCGVMTADSTWFNFKCEDKRDYICEIKYGTWAPSLAPTVSPTLRPTHRPTHHHHPTAAPAPSTTTPAPTSITATGPGNQGSGDSSLDDSDKVHIDIHFSYVLAGVGILLLLTAVYRLRPQILAAISGIGGKSNQSARFNDSDVTSSSHNLVEMETRKTYGDVGEQSTEEIDLGGCFAFSNSSAEEMLASQLNVKVYSAVDNDLNTS